MTRRSVVLVDDLAELRQILRLILEHGGPFKVVGEGANGHDAVTLAAEHHPDLLLMDVEMPGGPSGWAVLAEVAEVAPETVVVILSGSRGERRPDGGPEPAAVLEKGLPPKELNAALVALLDIDDREVAAPAPSAAPSAGSEHPPRRPAELENFASVAGHDLAQPLQVAYGYLEMLRADFGETLDPRAAEWLAAAIGSLDRMRALVQAVLAFARAGSRPPEVTTVELSSALDDAADQLASELSTAGAHLERQPLPAVDADPAQLVTVLAALVDNALRFARPGVPPTISVGAHEDAGGWTVTVADDGPGFPEGLRHEAFEAFQRSAGPSGRGPGLGLAICQKVVEGHGGRIWIDDTAGAGAEGAVVRFTLPRRSTGGRPAD